MRHAEVDEGSEGQRLDNFLLKLFKGVPKTHVYRLIRGGEVRVNKGRAAADTRLHLGDVVRLPPVRLPQPAAVEAAPTPPREFPIVFEDELLLVLDKPAGVAVHGGSGVSFGVIEQLRRARPQARFLELVHRLDKETSGLLVIAKRRSALTALQAQWRAGAAEGGAVKRYQALVVGAWPARQKVIDLPLHKGLDARGERHVRVAAPGASEALRAITLVRTLAAFDGFTLLELTLKTGRTHQIRVHLAHHGHPIVGDERYGDFAQNRQWARSVAAGGLGAARMFLHARRLELSHPADGRRLSLEAELPAECQALLARLAEPH